MDKLAGLIHLCECLHGRCTHDKFSYECFTINCDCPEYRAISDSENRRLLKKLYSNK